MTARVFDNRRCELGEGPLWHPERNQLYWFDILSRQMMTRSGDAVRRWQFDEYTSAAGWIDRDHLLVASETQLFRLNLENAAEDHICGLEADMADTRSNDGRADRLGGFWIGTMSKTAEQGRGRIYRYYRGEVRQLVDGITIPNAICFAPDGGRAYYACSLARKIYTVSLDAEGWPKSDAKVFLDLNAEGLIPDGAVTDDAGNLWNAQWGAFRVACYDPDGAFRHAYDIPAKHASCPAFGGSDYATLFCTTALELLDPEEAARSENGMTFEIATGARGLPEPRVVL